MNGFKAHTEQWKGFSSALLVFKAPDWKSPLGSQIIYLVEGSFQLPAPGGGKCFILLLSIGDPLSQEIHLLQEFIPLVLE